MPPTTLPYRHIWLAESSGVFSVAMGPSCKCMRIMHYARRWPSVEACPSLLLGSYVYQRIKASFGNHPHAHHTPPRFPRTILQHRRRATSALQSVPQMRATWKLQRPIPSPSGSKVSPCILIYNNIYIIYIYVFMCRSRSSSGSRSQINTHFYLFLV